ncbi:hypothetical protein JZU56_05490, partial [bacterium]|nr:hypothetical protein [bacterium]
NHHIDIFDAFGNCLLCQVHVPWKPLNCHVLLVFATQMMLRPDWAKRGGIIRDKFPGVQTAAKAPV